MDAITFYQTKPFKLILDYLSINSVGFMRLTNRELNLLLLKKIYIIFLFFKELVKGYGQLFASRGKRGHKIQWWNEIGVFYIGIESYGEFKGEKFMVFYYFINSFSSQKFSKIK